MDEVTSLQFKFTRAKDDHTVTAIGEALSQVNACRDLEEGWDGEDALPVSNETADLAQSLLIRFAKAAAKRRLVWHTPGVSPDPEGRLHLLWQGPKCRTLLIVSADQNHLVSVRTVEGEEPRREVVNSQKAIEHVMQALQRD